MTKGLTTLKYCSNSENVEFQRNYLFEKLKFVLIGKGRKKNTKMDGNPRASCFMQIQQCKAGIYNS